MRNNGYSNEQLMQMQRDAMRRVNEMQRISKEKLKESSGAVTEKEEPKPQKIKAEEIPCGCKPRQSPPNFDISTTFKGMLSRMKLDSDSVILIMLLILFLNEGADSKLILALVYILI